MKKTFISLFAVLALGMTACASADKPEAGKATDTTKAAEKVTMSKPAAKDTTKAADKKVEFTTTKSGLKFLDTKVGTGAEAVPGTHIKVDYTVWLYVNGQKKGDPLDSSIPRKEPYPLILGNHEVIAGWDEGLVGMKVGGTRTLIVPPHLAYGEQGMGGAIPPNSTLIFECAMMDVKK